ncbi:MAG: septal ring lytic transglycosylase RlpA family protein [Caulobacteraceae bacterium]
MRPLRILAACLALGGLAACATAPPARIAGSGGPGGPRVPAYNRPYEIHGRWYTPSSQPHYDVVGVASWYSYESPSRTTADGEPFNARWATAAHTTLPLPSYLEVTNLDNGRRLRVRLNDRGPFAPGRIIDLTRGAAEQLGFVNRGTAHVRVRYLGPAPPYGHKDYLAEANAAPPAAIVSGPESRYSDPPRPSGSDVPPGEPPSPQP